MAEQGSLRRKFPDADGPAACQASLRASDATARNRPSQEFSFAFPALRTLYTYRRPTSQSSTF